jgi:hypothetical protein
VWRWRSIRPVDDGGNRSDEEKGKQPQEKGIQLFIDRAQFT